MNKVISVIIVLLLMPSRYL